MIVTFTAKFDIEETNYPEEKVKEIFSASALPDFGVFIMEGKNADGEIEEDYYQLYINSSEIIEIKIQSDLLSKNWKPCGTGENICNCKAPEECGYKNPLWDEIKPTP